MNVFAKFDEIPSMVLQDIKETKRYGHTDGRSVGRSDNLKTVYPPTNKVCGGYNDVNRYIVFMFSSFEPRHEKTSVLVSDLLRHKPGCTATENG